MKLAQIGHLLLHPTADKTWNIREYFESLLAGLIGVLFGLLMGMTALTALLGAEAATEPGKPGLLFIKVIVVGTFVIFSVILFTWKFGQDEEDSE